MPQTILCPTEPKGQITFKYASKEATFKTDHPPIYLNEESRFLYPAWAMWGETTLSKGSSEIWVNFYTLPAGHSASDYQNDLYSGKRRASVRYQQSFNDIWTYYYNKQVIFQVEANSYGPFGQEFISLPGDKENLLNLLNSFFPGRPRRIYNDFSPGTVWKFAECKDSWQTFKYKSDWTLGEYTYTFSCGGCKEDEFSAPDDSEQGYRCIPYEDVIEFSKQQRQRLNKVAQDLD
jgi:hypothetical protein